MTDLVGDSDDDLGDDDGDCPAAELARRRRRTRPRTKAGFDLRAA
jgi:hypothetical protein